MKIKYKLKGRESSGLFDTPEKIIEWFEGMNEAWIEKNIIEIDVHSNEYIMRDIPEEFHSALSYMAYERGHSAGEEEIRNILMGLVEDLKPSFEKYEHRIIGQYE